MPLIFIKQYYSRKMLIVIFVGELHCSESMRMLKHDDNLVYFPFFFLLEYSKKSLFPFTTINRMRLFKNYFLNQ